MWSCLEHHSWSRFRKEGACSRCQSRGHEVRAHGVAQAYLRSVSRYVYDLVDAQVVAGERDRTFLTDYTVNLLP